MICPACGKEASANDQRCAACGVQFALSSQSGSVAGAESLSGGNTFSGWGPTMGQGPNSKYSDLAAGLPPLGGAASRAGWTTLTPPEPFDPDTTGLPRPAGGVRHRRPLSTSMLE